MSCLLIWDELALLWNQQDFRAVHDWLNEHWARLVQESASAERDVIAGFLQGLAFAALAFHFAREGNEESAGLFLEDALKVLPQFAPAYAGIRITPIQDALSELHSRMTLPANGKGLLLRSVPFVPLRFTAGNKVAV